MNTDQVLQELHQEVFDCESIFRAARFAYANGFATELELHQAEKDLQDADEQLEAFEWFRSRGAYDNV